MNDSFRIWEPFALILVADNILVYIIATRRLQIHESHVNIDLAPNPRNGSRYILPHSFDIVLVLRRCH